VTGYYDDGSNAAACTKCSENCEKCSDSKTCTGCKNDANLEAEPVDGKCVCKPGFGY